ncbi:class I SAM-dependent methyltransferase [Pseudoduganella armeniaca]|uniref:Methyltransferase n=1 Tax=Pseudoduganella armeniaca TaxID=2072590 RepID=A0A2R4CFI1_9BURK|nr:class I SAM-dependent methyltransferase [Pseudoduganella armeniaca]AVR98393.1 methyltransferase [Pseudoduganella armeniaca]
MTDWTAGYTADIGYTYGYYGELNPLRARLALAYAGLACPTFENACELGFGQGVSITMHAAAGTVRWFGTDFNPSQAGFAQQLAGQCGVQVDLSDAAFDEFAQRADLPQFDYIGLHGIWSWISHENRAVLVDFLRRRLKVGGVLYISYNTMPGWAAFAPMRHLMNRHAATMSPAGWGSTGKVEQAIDFAEKLLATDPAYVKANPAVPGRLQGIKGLNRQYLAHEYFNRDWHPMHFADVAELLHGAKLQFACSASYLDLIPALNLSPSQQAFLGELNDHGLRESVRDFMVNQQFRRDFWVKGARQLTMLDRAEALRGQRLVLVKRREDVAPSVTGPAGKADLTPAIYSPVLDALADHTPRDIGNLIDTLGPQGLVPLVVTEALMLLCGMGVVAPANDDATVQALRPRTVALNAELCRRGRSSSDIGMLASPLTGGGIPVQRFSQLFLLALQDGANAPGDMARYAWKILDAQGQRLNVEGAVLATPEQNLAQLERHAQAFMEKELPLLRSLYVA